MNCNKLIGFWHLFLSLLSQCFSSAYLTLVGKCLIYWSSWQQVNTLMKCFHLQHTLWYHWTNQSQFPNVYYYWLFGVTCVGEAKSELNLHPPVSPRGLSRWCLVDHYIRASPNYFTNSALVTLLYTWPPLNVLWLIYRNGVFSTVTLSASMKRERFKLTYNIQCRL